MYLNESMESHLKKLNRQIKSLTQKMNGLRDGPLYISKVGPYYSWKTRGKDGNIIYIAKDEENYAAELALRRYYKAFIHDLKAQAEAVRRYTNYQKRSFSAVERLLESESEEYVRLLGKALITSDERIAAWENAPYEKSKAYPDTLKYKTMKTGELVRSKLEAMVAACLTALGLAYRYEQIIHINEWEIAADFTVLDPRTMQEIPLEVFGMMDDPTYRKTYRAKMKTYIDGGYIPGVNMLTFYESTDAPLGQAEILDELHRFFFEKPPILL